MEFVKKTIDTFIFSNYWKYTPRQVKFTNPIDLKSLIQYL